MKQPAHFDFDPSKVVHLPDNQKPLLTLVALEDNTYMDVWVGYKLLLDGSLCTPLRSTRIKLNKGDLLVFLGACTTSGCIVISQFSTRMSHVLRIKLTECPRLNGEFSYLRGLVDEELSEPIVAVRMRHGDTDF